MSAQDSDHQSTIETSVLIIGGGPVGLALAAELGWRGVDCVLVERTDGVITSPRMNEVNIRSMEFCRRWGIAEKVRNCPFPDDHPMDVALVTSLAGYEIGRVPRPARKLQTPSANSPEHLQVCSQFWFDPILRHHVATLPTVTLRHRNRMTEFREEATGITATVRDEMTGRNIIIGCAFMAACDGAASSVRNRLAIGVDGDSAMGRAVNLFFRAPDLLRRCGRAPGVFFLAIDRHGLWANIRVIDPKNDLWRIMILDLPEDFSLETLDRDEVVRRAIGRDWPVDWVDVTPWTRRGVVAKHFRSGRVFLVGDAAHQLSPTGGLGMNTGIGDAVDLGWKLWARLAGWGGPRLLDSYESERRGVALTNVATTTELHNDHFGFDGFVEIDAPTEAGVALRAKLGASLVDLIRRVFRTEGLQIGYCYDGSPICAREASAEMPFSAEIYRPSARPGARAPHAWIAPDRSTLDLFGRGYVLMDLGGDRKIADRFVAAAHARRVPLVVERIDDPAVATLYEVPLVLVRPDGHVAWRGPTSGAVDAGSLIDLARGA